MIRFSRSEIEVEFGRVSSVVFNQLLIDNAAWVRVSQLASSFILYEEALGDTLVHNDNSDFRSVGCLVVHAIDGGFELRDLF